MRGRGAGCGAPDVEASGMTTRRRALAGLVLGAVALGAPLPAFGGGRAALPEVPAGRAAESLRLIDEEDAVTCLEAAPEAYAVPLNGDDITLSVLVLLDGVPRDRGQEVMGLAATSYEPLNIKLVSSFRSVRFTGDTPDPQGIPTGNADLLFEQMKKSVPGGKRPAGIDLVYLLTDKDIFTGTADDEGHTPESSRGYGVAGIADCIGGVRFDEHAFAMGEDFRLENLAAGPVEFYVNGTAKIAAHELGHLMGGHHHYANCAEGAPTEPTEGTVCTLMSNYIDFISLNFSQLNGVIVRGHAEEYATP